MSATLKIIQISDPHLCATAGETCLDWPVDQAWENALSHAHIHHPDVDAWVISGDLVDDETVAGYKRFNQLLADFKQPVMALAGNHDDPAAMREHLTHADVHTTTQIGDLIIHTLDSHIDGTAAGELRDSELVRLRKALKAHSGPTLIFLHHPPVKIGADWLDNINLKNGDALAAIVAEHPQVLAVSSGHAHQEFTGQIAHAPCWVTPSTMRQFLPKSADFALDDDALPGYRVIKINTQQRTVETQVERLAKPDSLNLG